LFVGEIGLPRREYLYDIRFWEARRILSGYNRRHRDLWSATRWQTYNLMAAQVGGKELAKNGINSATDLLPLPWDTKAASKLPTEEEVADMVAEIDAINAARNKKDSE
jgi:hypothetical protein